MRVIFLGTGTSFGVPQIGCHCAVCRSTDPRDKRNRVGAIVETNGGTRLLIDTPPELRLQLIRSAIDSVDALLFTHDHADHVQGLDDVRAFTARTSPLSIYGSEETLDHIATRFRYIFDDQVQPPRGTSKPRATLHPLRDGEAVVIGDEHVMPIAVPHGTNTVLAYRIGSLGYVTDAKTVPPDAVARLRGVSVLVLNALLHQPHPTHLSISEAVAVAAEIGAPRTYLTHLTHQSFHADLEAELPAGVTPAFDGLVIQTD